MKKFSIKCTGSSVEDAMEQINGLSELDPKQKNCLVLLTEEMFSMMGSILSNKEATFAIAKVENEWTMTMAIETHASEKARQTYLTLASNGKNLAHKGLKGLFNAFFDALNTAATNASAEALVESSAFVENWQLSQYLDSLNEDEKASAWDGLERSIIANFADDIGVSITNNKVKVVVKKSF